MRSGFSLNNNCRQGNFSGGQPTTNTRMLEKQQGKGVFAIFGVLSIMYVHGIFFSDHRQCYFSDLSSVGVLVLSQTVLLDIAAG